jgi:hypothetical protein
LFIDLLSLSANVGYSSSTATAEVKAGAGTDIEADADVTLSATATSESIINTLGIKWGFTCMPPPRLYRRPTLKSGASVRAGNKITIE